MFTIVQLNVGYFSKTNRIGIKRRIFTYNILVNTLYYKVYSIIWDGFIHERSKITSDAAMAPGAGHDYHWAIVRL
jgi:hypothetical protein